MAMTAARRPTIKDGLLALVKSLVLLAGVPLALARLWFVTPLPTHLMSASSLASLAAWSHASVLLVGFVWALASLQLLREIAGALRDGDKPGSEWSTRWAIAIAALVVAATTAPSYLPGSRGVIPRSSSTARARHDFRAARPILDHVQPLAAECLAELAERVGGCADDWPAIAELNFGALQPDGSRMLDPARLRSGWHLRLPSSARRPQAARARSSASAARLVELALIGLGVVTLCALARRVRVLRRRDSAMRREGEFPARSDAQVSSLDAAVAPYADAPILDWIDAANRLLSRAGGAGPFDVRLARAGPDGVEFLLAEPLAEAPWPFRAERGGRWWRLDPLVDLATLIDAASGLPRRCPALIPVGDDEGASYLVPLQPGRRLGITGAPDLVDAALAAIVMALRVAPWSEQCAIELVGVAPPPAHEQCYQLQSSRLGALGSLSDDAASRLRTPDDVVVRQPILVVARDALPEGNETILEKASKVAGIIVAGHGGTAVVHVDEFGAVLHPFAIALSGAVPSPSQLTLADSLLAAAARPSQIVPIGDHQSPDSGELQSNPPAGVVECRVLRASPDIAGLAQLPYRGDADRVVECLAYVALHGGRAKVEAIADALFARSDRALRRGRAENALSALRACLGDGPSGQRLLARDGDEVSLSDEVSCDWTRVERSITAARTAAPRHALGLLRAALEVVDGPPCAAVIAGFGWLRAESIAQQIEGTLVDGAHRLCALALADGDTVLARWAVETGRRCAPASEILGRDLMSVSDAEGDQLGMRSAYAELEAALERLLHNEPSAESRALFDALEGD